MTERDPDEEAGMIVVDLLGVDARLSLARGVEIVVPVQKFGVRVDLEIGSGGRLECGWVRLQVAKLRVWFVHETRKLFVSFMERPDLIPHWHVNADRGKGDFGNLRMLETTTEFDNVLENVLATLGPKKTKSELEQMKTVENDIDNHTSSSNSTSWIMTAIGNVLIKFLKRKAKLSPGRPLEIDLKDRLDRQVNTLLGRHMPSSYLRAKIEKLQAELKVAEEFERAEQEEQGQKERERKGHEQKEGLDDPGKEGQPAKVQCEGSNATEDSTDVDSVIEMPFCGVGCGALALPATSATMNESASHFRQFISTTVLYPQVAGFSTQS